MPRPSSPYRIAFDPQAWRQIGQMPHHRFQAFQAALDAIPQEMDTAPQPRESAEIERCTTAAGFVVTDKRNDAERTLTVLEVRPVPRAP